MGAVPIGSYFTMEEVHDVYGAYRFIHASLSLLVQDEQELSIYLLCLQFLRIFEESGLEDATQPQICNMETLQSLHNRYDSPAYCSILADWAARVWVETFRKRSPRL